MGNPAGNLIANRHDRGWPKAQVLTFITVTNQSWRYCIEPMGHRDVVWYRAGYVELVRWINTQHWDDNGCTRADLCLPPLPVRPSDQDEGED
jgi:hypothetical protein